MAKGFYLYCIREKGSRGGFSTEGIEGGEVFGIPEQDLEAVVSEVPLEEFTSSEIQRKAQEDLVWIKEKAQLHENVVEQAMKAGERIVSVVPMKFGTIFNSKEKLVWTLKKYYSKFKHALENLRGKQEWAVKMYLNRHTFEKEFKKVSQMVQEKEKEIAHLPEGLAYFRQKQIDEMASKEAGKVLPRYAENFFGEIKKYAAAATRGKILEKELTGNRFPMILNGVFLISEENLDDFLKEIKRLNKEYEPKGFNLEYSGPWPPYNFI